MDTTNDFEEWLAENDLSDYDDVDSLYRTVNELSDYGMFSIKEANGNNNGWILYSDDCDKTLHILNENARTGFLRMIEYRYCEGMSEEGWYAYHKAMEKDD